MYKGKGISEAVRKIIDSDPCMQEALAARVISYSELARRIHPMVERLIGDQVSVNSIKIALTRYTPPQSRGRAPRRRVLDLLARSSLELRSSVAVVTAYRDKFRQVLKALLEIESKARLLLVLQSINTFTLIIDEEHLDTIVEMLGDSVVETYRGQAAVIIVSPEDLVRVPGFVAHVTSLIASEGINITQIESSYTDTILVLDKDDAMRAFDILNKAIEIAKQQLGITSQPTGQG
ncbi:MAG: ACT domain-containing protein [Desulfurococcales archaeon]|nr:ACT domain-containing protein [Desulfurococcales archaeon]